MIKTPTKFIIGVAADQDRPIADMGIAAMDLFISEDHPCYEEIADEYSGSAFRPTDFVYSYITTPIEAILTSTQYATIYAVRRVTRND